LLKFGRNFWIAVAATIAGVVVPLLGVYLFAHAVPNLERAPAATSICNFDCDATRLDLIAQQNMAQAAWGMIGVTIVMFAANVLTLLFLWVTIREAKLTRAEAARSAKAAEEAVEEAQRMTDITARHGMAQARAYVSATSCQVLVTNGGAQFQIAYTNSGQSPARSPSILTVAKLELRPPDGADYESPGAPLTSELFLPEISASGADLIVGESFTLDYLQTQFPIERLGRAIVLIEGHFKYADVFGAWHTEEFAFVLAFAGPPQPGSYILTRKPLGSDNRY
jgi:hypothetical protein